MKVRALTAVAALALAAVATPPIVLQQLGSGGPPLVAVESWIQQINVLTS
ncbi:hypothetical protein ACFOY2_19600 [Nonomuraea purpurea]|uniref:Uncharacterized protein n=1 Tax=Nonomuraea purpurea TaxID=1849276 RepID=A0ABV8G9C3_9ACTN